MKKIISLLLCMVLVLGCVSALAEGADDVTVAEGMRLSYDGIFYDEFLDSEATITVKLENKGSKDAVPVTFVVAEYTEADGCRTMVGFKRITDSIGASESKGFELKYDVDSSKNIINVFAFCSTSMGVVSLGSFELDAFQYVGNESEDVSGQVSTSVYKINKFEE